MDWLDIKHVLVVFQNILWTCIRFYVRNKKSNIALAKAKVNINNSLVEAKSIILIDALNLDILNLFNDLNDKINHVIADGMLELGLLSRKWGCLLVW